MGYADIHSHNTRYASNHNFHVPRIRSIMPHKSVITKISEEIPTSMKALSYYQFKKQYKRILLNY